jgi:hypothetical protein
MAETLVSRCRQRSSALVLHAGLRVRVCGAGWWCGWFPVVDTLLGPEGTSTVCLFSSGLPDPGS